MYCGKNPSNLMIDSNRRLYHKLADRLDYNYFNTFDEDTHAQSVS